jgi:hypothetical protein
VGHNSEYVVAAPEQAVRDWLATLSGFDTTDPDDSSLGWEGDLDSGGSFWAYPVAGVTLFALSAKYTWFFNGDPPTLDFARRFERDVWRGVGPYELVRLDESLRSQWEQHVGREWWQIDTPLSPLLDWLAAEEQTHWRLLKPDGGSSAGT